LKKTFAVFGAVLVCLVPLPAPRQQLEGLVKKVLAALETKDQPALEKLAITEDGYRKYIWPGIAARTPGANEKKFYGMFEQGNSAGISSALKEFGGQKLELVKVSAGTPIRQTKAYRLLSPPTVTVRDGNGPEKALKLTGPVIEHDGIYQIATFAVTPAQQTESSEARR
jgi:hypothetical protein